MVNLCDFCWSVCSTREQTFGCGIVAESVVKDLEITYRLGA